MKISLLLLLTFFLSLAFLSCSSTKPKGVSADSHQQATNTTRGFPAVIRPANNVNCRNCYATFKLSSATQKQAHGHSFTACPVCNKDYLKKAK